MKWMWAGWVLGILTTFALLEAYAIQTGKETLSACVWQASQGFPLLPFLGGLVAGGLAVHFWWRQGG